ncbi:MAG: CesT family type III secretion system chaperone [Noviherbaspirillum sp.]
MIEDMHAGLAGYLRRTGMETGDEREDGGVVLVVDGQYRVYCHPAPGRALVLEARLARLPEDGAAADALLAAALLAAAPRLAPHAQALALAPDGAALLLQQWLDADGSVAEFEKGLEDFINAIGYYHTLPGMG